MTTLQNQSDIKQAVATSERTFSQIRLLLGALFAVSLGAVAFALFARSNPDLVNGVVWIRGIAVVAASVIFFILARLAEAGRVWAWKRLRLLSFIVPGGVVLLIVAPGAFPLWMKLEQGVCGAIILGVGILLTRVHMRGTLAAITGSGERRVGR